MSYKKVYNQKAYNQKIYKRILAFPPHSVFLFGVRGSGKTSLLKKIFPKAFYIDLLDGSIYQSYLTNMALFYDELSLLKKGSLVVVDEIQKLPSLLNEVHRLIESRSLRFILTGSSARKIRARGVNLLAGRAGWLTLHPFTPEELGKDFDLNKALQFGMLPLVFSSKAPDFALKAYTQLYLKEEIKEEALVRNLPGFARFLHIAGLYHGQCVNMSGIARESEISRDAVRGFFSILEDSLLGFFLPAYSSKIRLREQKHPKFYFIDPGLARVLKGDSGPIGQEEKGALFEGLVAQILRAYGDYRQVFDSFFYWSPSNAKKTKVDFLLKRGSRELIAIEAKARPKVFSDDLKGLKAIADMPHIKRRILVYMGNRSRKTEEGIEIWSFSHWCEVLKKGLL